MLVERRNENIKVECSTLCFLDCINSFQLRLFHTRKGHFTTTSFRHYILFVGVQLVFKETR
jgi:hypothetical protein